MCMTQQNLTWRIEPMSPKSNIFGTVAVMLWESVSKYLEAVLHIHNVLLSGFVVSVICLCLF